VSAFGQDRKGKNMVFSKEEKQLLFGIFNKINQSLNEEIDQSWTTTEDLFFTMDSGTFKTFCSIYNKLEQNT